MIIEQITTVLSQTTTLLHELTASVRFVQTLTRRVVHAVSRTLADATRSSFWRDAEVGLGSTEGETGERKWIRVAPQGVFRGEKLMATDTYFPEGSPVGGHGTRILSILVGDKMQRQGAGTLTAFFGPGTLGNGSRWDTCRLGQEIAMEVEFLKTCRFDATIFGKVLVDTDSLNDQAFSLAA